MCGICGIYNFSLNSASQVEENLVKRMCDKILHRGPDDSGVFVKGPIGLGNRRLSIIDLSKGHQPIFNEDGSIVIVYNGEVYNFHEIRDHLIKKGHIFTTDTDTETILHAYEEYGIECLQYFNGMFSFAIWDDNRKRLFLARDRLGIKPLFYSIQNGSLIFGSEIKCILEVIKNNRNINFQGLDHYFSLGYIPAPHTIFEGIQKLLPGHLMICDKNGIRLSRYWDVDFETKKKGREEDICEEFIELLKRSVKLQLISDVPLGAFLSGGIDSSLIVALMSEVSSSSPRTFSIGFDDAVYDESPYSEMIAKAYNTVHHNFLVKADIEDVLGNIVEAFDEPFADDGAIPSFHVCREARSKVKVALSGLGGDELFGGYHRYLGFQLSQFVSHIPLVHLDIWKRLVQRIPESQNGGYTVDRIKRFVEALSLPPADRYINYLYFMNNNRRKAFFNKDLNKYIKREKAFNELFAIYNKPKSDHEINRAYYLDIMTYLPEDVLALTDRMSMWHSLEVRVPFLDHNLVEFSAGLDPRLKIKKFVMKYFLKKAAKKFLPQTILNKKKQGFVGPMPLWLMRDLKDYTTDILSEKRLKRHNLFNQNMVNRIMEEHFQRKRKHETLIWAMLVFEKWYSEYMENR